MFPDSEWLSGLNLNVTVHVHPPSVWPSEAVYDGNRRGRRRCVQEDHENDIRTWQVAGYREKIPLTDTHGKYIRELELGGSDRRQPLQKELGPAGIWHH